MPRQARVVLCGVPHHVAQRGYERRQVFFDDEDYASYIALVHEAARKSATTIWAYCLMPNHVHFIAVPSDENGLRATFGEAHRQYAGYLNERYQGIGTVWQGRFGSEPMDDAHVWWALRYIALNPVEAGLVNRAEDWRWSSAAALLAGKDDALVAVAPVLERTGDFRTFLYGDEAL